MYLNPKDQDQLIMDNQPILHWKHFSSIKVVSVFFCFINGKHGDNIIAYLFVTSQARLPLALLLNSVKHLYTLVYWGLLRLKSSAQWWKLPGQLQMSTCGSESVGIPPSSPSSAKAWTTKLHTSECTCTHKTHTHLKPNSNKAQTFTLSGFNKIINKIIWS